MRIPWRIQSDFQRKAGGYGQRKSWESDGSRWTFDEFVLGEGAVHVEMMDERTAFVSVGDYRFSIWWGRGKAEVVLQEGPQEKAEQKTRKPCQSSTT